MRDITTTGLQNEGIIPDGYILNILAWQVLQALRQRDKGLWQKVKDYVLELCRKVREAYRGLKPDSLEGRMVAEMKDAAEEMRRLFTEGLVDAGENFTGGEKNTTREGGAVRYQLRAYSEHQKENWRNSKRIVLYENNNQFISFIQSALQRKDNTNRKLYFGAIGSDMATDILKATGINVDGFNLSLGENEIRKIEKDHGGSNSEKARGQRPVTADDLLRIPDVVQSPDSISLSPKMYEGKPVIEFAQRNGNERNVVIAVVSDKRLDLFVQTFYINKKSGSIATPEPVQAGSFTSETPSGTAPTSNIPPQDTSVKRKFSIRDQDVRKMNAVLEKQNEKLREDVASLKELLKLQKSVTGGKVLDRKSVDTAARFLIKNAGAKGNTAELSGLLNDVYTYMAGDAAISWEGIMERAQPAADWIAAHTETKQQLDPYGAEVLRELRGSRISLDESQRAEAEYQFGSVNALRKQLFGTVTITDKDAVSLDSKWAELSELYPDVFDANTPAADMPGALLDAIDSLKNMGIGEAWYDQEAARQDLLQQIYDGYWRVSTLHTVADVKQKQINRLKIEHFDRLNQVKTQYQDAVRKLKAEHRADMKKLREDLRSSSLEKQAEIQGLNQQLAQLDSAYTEGVNSL